MAANTSLQRLIIAVGGESNPASSVAAALVRNACVPTSDIQLSPLNRILTPHISASNHRSSKNNKKSKSQRGGKTSTLPASQDRQWHAPHFRDFCCSLWCERLMLGEAPVRSAVVVPSSVSETGECVRRVLLQFRNLLPEDILLVVARARSQQHVYLGPLRNHDDGQQDKNLAVVNAVDAIKWRFQDQTDDDGNNISVDDDESDVSLVSLLEFADNSHIPREVVKKDHDDVIDVDYDFLAFVAAMSCTHPEHAARAVDLYNNDKLSNLVGGTMNNNNNNSSTRDSVSSSSITSRCFQYSMLSVKHEALLNARRDPERMRAFVPGVAPTQLRQRGDILLERVEEEKRPYEERARAEAKNVLTRLGRLV